MKSKVIKTVCTVLVILLILAMAALYFYEVLVLKVPYTQNLLRTVAVVGAGCVSLVRLLSGTGRKHLAVYEKAYADEIGTAFGNEPKLRKKLLCACRFYDESSYNKALKYLGQLLREAEVSKDKLPVLLFTALCYTDMHMPQQAIKVYNDLLRIDPGNVQAHSNLGMLYVHIGDFPQAISHYNRAVELKPDHYYAYANRANYYFRIQELDAAITDAHKALQIKQNGREAAALLAIIYALRADEESQKKYFHIALASGQNGRELNAAIEYYKTQLYAET